MASIKEGAEQLIDGSEQSSAAFEALERDFQEVGAAY